MQNIVSALALFTICGAHCLNCEVERFDDDDNSLKGKTPGLGIACCVRAGKFFMCMHISKMTICQTRHKKAECTAVPREARQSNLALRG